MMKYDSGRPSTLDDYDDDEAYLLQQKKMLEMELQSMSGLGPASSFQFEDNDDDDDEEERFLAEEARRLQAELYGESFVTTAAPAPRSASPAPVKRVAEVRVQPETEPVRVIAKPTAAPANQANSLFSNANAKELVKQVVVNMQKLRVHAAFAHCWLTYGRMPL